MTDPDGSSRTVRVSLAQYGHLDHGYAATVHKTQGVTVNRAHVLATAGMDRHMAYVALTRHRDSVALHWSADELGSREGLLRTLGRERLKDTSLDYGEDAEPVASAAAAARHDGRRRALRGAARTASAGAGQPDHRARRPGRTRQMVSLPALVRRKAEQRALAEGLRPMLELLREQKQLLGRVVEQVGRRAISAAVGCHVEHISPAIA